MPSILGSNPVLAVFLWYFLWGGLSLSSLACDRALKSVLFWNSVLESPFSHMLSLQLFISEKDDILARICLIPLSYSSVGLKPSERRDPIYWAFSVSLYLSLSLTHAHTHTHTHAPGWLGCWTWRHPASQDARGARECPRFRDLENPTRVFLGRGFSLSLCIYFFAFLNLLLFF